MTQTRREREEKTIADIRLWRYNPVDNGILADGLEAAHRREDAIRALPRLGVSYDEGGPHIGAFMEEREDGGYLDEDDVLRILDEWDAASSA